MLFNDHVLSSNKNGQPVSVNDVDVTQQQSQQHDDDNGDGGNEHTISYTTVISGEYTTSTTAATTAIQNQNQVMISNDEFHNMLTHVTTKFQGHLLKYLHDVSSSTSSSSSSSAKNLDLRNVRSVVLDDFERIGSNTSSSSSDALEIMGMSMTTSTVHIVSIIAIVISALVFVMLSIATVRYHK